MNAKLYISRTEIALDFESQKERDEFLNNMAKSESFGFSPRDAAVKSGDKSIRFDLGKFRIGWVWKISFTS